MHVDFNNPRPPFPREVFFDITSACNCKCFFCANTKIGKGLYLDKSLTFRLLQDFYDMGTREVGLYATGEPFLSEDLPDFVLRAKKVGYDYIFTVSNGCLAVPKRAKPVLCAGLDSIKFSVNAGRRESYAKVHGVDQFDNVIENIKWFYDYRKKSGLNYKIYVSMVPSSMTEGEWPILCKLLSPYADEMDYRGCSNQGGNMPENNLTEKIEKDNLLGSLHESQFTGKCPDIFSRCMVTAEGFLSACVVDYQNYLVVADLNKTPVKTAWNNEAYVKLRKMHITNKLEGLICYSCLNNCQNHAAPLRPEYTRPFKEGREYKDENKI